RRYLYRRHRPKQTRDAHCHKVENRRNHRLARGRKRTQQPDQDLEMLEYFSAAAAAELRARCPSRLRAALRSRGLGGRGVGGLHFDELTWFWREQYDSDSYD